MIHYAGGGEYQGSLLRTYWFNAMTASSSGTDPLPDDPEEANEDEVSERAASSPEEARAAAEDALAQVEALADLDESAESDTEDTPGGEEQTTSTEEAFEAESSPPPDEGPPEDQCGNCGALLDGPYCSECGQRAADRIVPVWHMINEALEAVFELDLRVFRTFPKFVFLPGRLTKEYINGKRKRYIRPFRLCLFATFLLFAVLAFTTTGSFGLVLDPQGMVRLNPPNTGVTASSTEATASGSSLFGDPDRREEIAQNIESDTSGFHIGLFDDPETNDRVGTALRLKTAQVVRNPQEFVESIIDRGPYLMFFLLPIFALLLKLLYVRRGRLYAEHMIFSLHVHAFAFFAFTVGLLLDQSGSNWLTTAATLIELSPLLYLVVAMSHVYEQGLLKSSVKAFLLLFVYGFILVIGVLLLVILVALFM